MDPDSAQGVLGRPCGGSEGANSNRAQQQDCGTQEGIPKEGRSCSFLADGGIKHSPDARMAVLFKVGEEGIHADFAPTAEEKMGFGQYGHLSMQEVLNTDPGYVNWCQRTLKEEENSGWRLRRFVQWVHHQHAMPKDKPVAKAKTHHVKACGSQYPSSAAKDLARQWSILDGKKQAVEASVAACEKATSPWQRMHA